MNFAEVLWRAQDALRIPQDWAAMHRGYNGHSATYDLRSRNYPIFSHTQAPPFDTFRIFDVELSTHQQFEWNRDYKHGGSAPEWFCRLIDLQEQNQSADIKYIWELNRHQFLSALAFSSDPSAPDLIASHLHSWLRKNPYLVGVNWSSSLELALRLISWALLYPSAQSRIDQDAELRALFYNSVYRHLARIRARLSRYSSANNHLIGELAGLYIGAKCFNCWPENVSWSQFARNTLEKEIVLQVSPDGINREQAISYQLFTTELFFLAFIVGKNCGEPFNAQYRDRLHAMVNFILDLATPTGELPAYGDSDDARGFLVSMGETSFEVICQLAFLEFGDDRFLKFIPDHPLAYRALCEHDFLTKQSAIEDSPVFSSVRKSGGIAVFGTDDVKVFMDFGHLGYTSIAAHGHADALSIQLAVGGEYILIDPGTYAYHSHPEWRSYFRSTTAHNTAVIDGLDQSEMAGRFLWSRKAQCRLLAFHESDHCFEIEAEQDGYTRLSAPVLHRRRLAFKVDGPSLLIRDHFMASGSHDICLHWHAHERAVWNICGPGAATLAFGNVRLHFTLSGVDANMEIFYGSTSPILGWRSRSFDLKEPTPVLRASTRINGDTIITTKIEISKP